MRKVAPMTPGKKVINSPEGSHSTGDHQNSLLVLAEGLEKEKLTVFVPDNVPNRSCSHDGSVSESNSTITGYRGLCGNS